MVEIITLFAGLEARARDTMNTFTLNDIYTYYKMQIQIMIINREVRI